MSSMKTTRTPEDWSKVDPLYLMQRVARGETSGTAAYNLMRDALADIASLATLCRELEKVSDDAIGRNTLLETECDDLRAELDHLRRREKEVRENSPLLIRLDSAEAERDVLQQRCRDLEFASASHEQAAAYWKKRFDEDSSEAIDLLKSERDALSAEVERLRQSLRSVIVAAGGSAAPDVSAEFLELAPLEVLALRGNLDQLQARLRRIESIAECGSVQSWLALPDDARAQWFAMHLEMDDERRALRQDAVRIEWMASQARMIYGRKGEASYQLEELPELIHSDREECRPDDLRRAIDEAMEESHDEG